MAIPVKISEYINRFKKEIKIKTNGIFGVNLKKNIALFEKIQLKI